ncbi:MAG: hypothetical protein A2539_07590 [Elusimicrobia bacterium RIFOXYD2_FULL_34_15]|nr:MAG: hypothetical protein A2539_07590 [Elusimicrobia bacterium RIFOXYD2_FULL_34_15]
MKKILTFVLYLIVYTIFVTKYIYSYDNGVIHPFHLTGKSIELLQDLEGNKYSEVYDNFYNHVIPEGYTGEKDWTGVNTMNLNLIERKGTLGTIDADEPVIKTRNHFYNPITGLGGAGEIIGQSAISYGQTFWDTAINLYNTGDKSNAYWNLGNVLHLLQDMSAVPHVFSDAHVLEYEGYENWISANTLLLSGGTEIQQSTPLTYEQMLKDIAEITYERAKIQGQLQKSNTQPATGDLGIMFPADPNDPSISGISFMKYVDFSGIGEEYWYISGVGYYIPLDTTGTTGGPEHSEWWEIPESPGYFYIEKPATAIPWIYKNSRRGIEIFNNQNKYSLAQFWANTEELIPLTINYTAGLMKFFYDTVNAYKVTVYPPLQNVSNGESNTFKISVYNKTNKDSNFQIELAFESSPGWTVSNPSASSFDITAGTTKTVTFTVANSNAISDIDIKLKVTGLEQTKTSECIAKASEWHAQVNPDDTYSVSSPQYPGTWLYDSESEIGILSNGFGIGLGYLLGNKGIATCIVKDDLTILNEPGRSINDLKVLLIGSAGLMGLDSSATFKQKLAEYTAQGGSRNGDNGSNYLIKKI